MRAWEKTPAAALAAAALLCLTACQNLTDDATAFVQGELEAAYLGQISQDYIDVTENMTEAAAREKHDYKVEEEAEDFLSYLAVDMPTDAVIQRARELVEEIYSHAQYTVGETDKLQSGDFVVEVTLSPIEIMTLLPEESYSEHWQAACAEKGSTTQEQLNSISEEEYAAIDAAYAMSMLEEIEALLPQLYYGEDQEIMLQLELGEDNYYSLVEEDWQHLDGVMIDYYGDYAGD